MAINLLAWRDKYRQYQLKQFLKLFVIFTLVPLVIMGILIANKKYLLVKQEKNISAYTQEVAGLKNKLYQRQSQADARMLVAINFYENSQNQLKKIIEIMAEISEKIPAYTFLMQVQNIENQLLIKGRASTQQELTNFFKELSALNFELKMLDNSENIIGDGLNFSASYKLQDNARI